MSDIKPSDPDFNAINSFLDAAPMPNGERVVKDVSGSPLDSGEPSDRTLERVLRSLTLVCPLDGRLHESRHPIDNSDYAERPLTDISKAKAELIAWAEGIIGEDFEGWSNFGKRDLTEAEEACNKLKAEQRRRLKEAA